MSSKKKLTISIIALALIVIAVVVAVTVVFAARETNFGGDFEGGYTANNVNAEITGHYAIVGSDVEIENIEEEWVQLTVADAEPANTIIFNDTISTGDPEATKSFDEVSGLVLTATESKVVFRYTIQNTGSEGDSFTIVGTRNGSFDNMTVDYFYQNGAGAVTNLGTTEPDGTTTNTHTINNGETYYVYVTITITDLDENASFDGGVNWTLSGVSAD